MRTITQSSTHPNIVLVTGIDPRQEYRHHVRWELHHSRTFPVRRGTHDFWLCFPYPPLSGDPASFGYSDLGARSDGRPLRGIGDMRSLPADTSAETMQEWLFTAIHEMAHSWLVPEELRIRQGGHEVELLRAGSLTDRLNRELPLDRPALLARGDAHWSCYVDFDSCMDAVGWQRSPDLGGLMQWTQQSAQRRSVAPPGLPAIETGTTFSDLDLYIMGAKRADECFPDTGGQFFWLEPKMSLGLPMRYLCGLFVAFSRTDFLYFGFRDDHGMLAAERSGTGERSQTTSIGNLYQPQRSESEAMMLRIVKRGQSYRCQACIGNDTVAMPPGQATPAMFGDLEMQRSSGDFRQWRNVAAFEAPGASPQAIGIITRTSNMILVETQAFSFHVHRGRITTLRELDVSPRDGTIAFGTLPSDRLAGEAPQAGALFRRSRDSMIMGVPYAASYDHSRDADGAPKMMMRAPTGDFAFGASLKVRRSFVSPWAGGSTHGMTISGVERSAQIRDVVVPERIREHWAPPAVNGPVPYKAAFIVVGGRFLPGPEELDRLDVFRRYFDAGVAAASGGRLSSDSRL